MEMKIKSVFIFIQRIRNHIYAFIVYNHYYTIVLVKQRALEVDMTVVPCDGEMERSLVMKRHVATLPSPQCHYLCLLIITGYVNG